MNLKEIRAPHTSGKFLVVLSFIYAVQNATLAERVDRIESAELDDNLHVKSVKRSPQTYWGNWLGWSDCQPEYGEIRSRFRYRYCKRKGYSGNRRAQECKPKDRSVWIEEIPCEAKAASQDGTWSAWHESSACPSCGGKEYSTYTRYCKSGSDCKGAQQKLEFCSILPCKPAFTDWSEWTACSVTCGGGAKTRNRQCMNGTDVSPMENCKRSDSFSEHIVSVRCGDVECYNISDNDKCGRVKGNAAKLRIYNGKVAEMGDMPWQGSFQYRPCVFSDCKWRHVCGVTLIHPQWSVTAGHCFEQSSVKINKDKPSQDKWQVFFGRFSSAAGSTFVSTMERVVVYNRYEFRYVPKSDIALIKMSTPVEFNDYIVPACLPKAATPESGETCYVSGYGYVDPKHQFAISVDRNRDMLWGEVKVVNHATCLKAGRYYRLLDPTAHVCAGGLTADTCAGDSGGPLVCKKGTARTGVRYYLSAVTSFSFSDCGTKGQWGIYTKVVTYENWIKQTIKDDVNYHRGVITYSGADDYGDYLGDFHDREG